MESEDRARGEWIAPGLAQLFEIVLDAADDQRDLTIGERERFFGAGGVAYDAGGSLSDLIEGYLAGAGQLWEHVFGATEPRKAVAVGRALRRVSERAVAGLAAGFEAAQRRSIRAEEALRRELIDDLLSGRADPATVEERARLAGFPIAAAYVVLVAEGDQPLSDSGPLHARAQTELDARAPQRDLMTFTKAGHLVVLAAAEDPAVLQVVDQVLRSVDPAAWRCGVGGRCRGLIDIDRGYRQALEAIRLSRAFGLDSFVLHDRLLPYRLMASDRAVAAALVETVVRPLEASTRGSLLETLRAFIDHGGNMAAVARALSVGPRTVAYRLDRIAEVTGHSPREPDGRLTLELALRCRELIGPDA
jgi:sugar diacid utilization regulator